MGTLGKLLAAAAFATAAVALIGAAAERHEIAECLQWQADAEEFANYYLTRWQADQCEHYNIKVDAPVTERENHESE